MPQEQQKINFKYISFKSTLPKKNQSEDSYTRYPIAEGLVEQLVNIDTDDSLVIGLYGAWGEGKTTLINFIKDVVQKKYFERFSIIDFNPWYYQSEDALQLELISEIVQQTVHEVGSNKSMIGRSWLQLRKLPHTKSKKAFDLATKGGKVLLKLIPQTGDAASEVYSQVMESVSSLFENNSVQEAKKKLVELLRESVEVNGELKTQRRKIVFIDDIDRLNSDEIYNVFRLIKNIGDLPNTVYILTFDEYLVADALKQRYGGSDRLGATFLDKVVQMPVIVPPKDKNDLFNLWTEQLDSACKEYGVNITDNDSRYIEPFLHLLKDFIHTPRAIVKHMNALRYALNYLKDEVNINDLIVIEAIRAFIPLLYNLIRRHQEMMLYHVYPEAKAYLKKKQNSFRVIIDETLAQLTKLEADNVEKILSLLFPANVLVYSADGGYWKVESDNRSLQRICTPEYFSRYFQYTVPAGTFSDKELKGIVSQIVKLQNAHGAERLKQLFSNTDQRNLIHWLDTHYKSFTPDELNQLIQCSALLPEGTIDFIPNRLSFFRSQPLDMYVSFLRDCIVRIATNEDSNSTPSNRADITTAQFENFAKICVSPFLLIELTWLFIDVFDLSKQTESSKGMIVSIAHASRIQKAVFDTLIRYQKEHSGPILFFNFFDYKGFWALRLWANIEGDDEINNQLNSYFSQSSTNGIRPFAELFDKLIKCLAPVSLDKNNIMRHIDFSEESSATVFSLIEPEKIIDWSAKQFPDENFDNAEFQTLYDKEWCDVLGLVKQLVFFAKRLLPPTNIS